MCRIQRDVAMRGRDIAGVIEQYTKFVKPAFDTFVAPSRKHADVIIPWGRSAALPRPQHAFHRLKSLMVLKSEIRLYVLLPDKRCLLDPKLKDLDSIKNFICRFLCIMLRTDQAGEKDDQHKRATAACVGLSCALLRASSLCLSMLGPPGRRMRWRSTSSQSTSA